MKVELVSKTAGVGKYSSLNSEGIVSATAIGEILEKEMPNVFAQIDWRNGMFM